MVNESFIENEKKKDKFFEIIFKTIEHEEKEKGKKFLILINSIINYYLDKKGETVLVPIIHFPNTEDWAKELFVEFLVLKNSVISGIGISEINKWKSTVRTYVNETQGLSGKSLKYRKIINKRTLIRNAITFAEHIEKEPNTLSNLLCTPNNAINNLPDFYYHFANKEFDNKNLSINTNVKRGPLSKEKNYGVFIENIENIFLINSGIAMLKTYNANEINRLNDDGCHFKRVIVFSFDANPFRAYRLIDNFKNGLNNKYNNGQLNNSFVTFTLNEINYIFDKKNNSNIINCGSKDSDYWESFCDIVEPDFQSPRYRNLFSLCCNDIVKDEINRIIDEQMDNDEDFINSITDNLLNSIKEQWRNEFIPIIEQYIGDANERIALIITFDATKLIKSEMKKYLKQHNISVKFYLLRDLKNSNQEITENKIIVLNYKSPNAYWKPYPNSFDDVKLRDNQQILELRNLSLFNNNILFDNYEYEKTIWNVLESDYRIDKLGWKVFSKNKPIIDNVINFDIKDDEYENETNTPSRLTIYYKDESKTSVSPSDLALVEQQVGKYEVSRIDEIAENLNEYNNIQLLKDFYDVVTDFINNANEQEVRLELTIRRNEIHKLTPEEIDGSDLLWKILLNREIINSGIEEVYSKLKPSVSISTFKNNWIVRDSSMILPRNKKDIKSLLQFLDLWNDQSYFRIIYRKKLRTTQSTKQQNSIIERLLQDILLIDISKETYDGLKEKHNDIFILLSISDYKTLQILIELLKENICFKKVKSIN